MKNTFVPFVFSLAIFFLMGCGNAEQSSANLTTNEQTSQEPTSRSLTEADTFVRTPSAAQRVAPDFSMAAEFPATYQLLSDNGQFSFVEFLVVYALPALRPQDIRSEADLINLLQSRKNILTGLTSVFKQIPAAKIDKQLPELQKEFGRIGIRLKTDQGNYAGFQSADAFQEVISTYATDPFTYYQAFIQAQERAQTAEFPFKDMEPYQDMVLAGEKLMTAFPNSVHYQSVRVDFRDALRNFVGIFVLQEGGYTTERLDNPMVDSERNSAETETHQQFVRQHASSQYAPIVARMLKLKSNTSKKPESLYAIYAGTAASLEEAREKQFEWLNKGEDVLHILPYDAGTQQEGHLLVYRFFEDEELSLQCLDEVQKRATHEIGYMKLSVNGKRMYQMGI
jgi:hypothetical protein